MLMHIYKFICYLFDRRAPHHATLVSMSATLARQNQTEPDKNENVERNPFNVVV